MKRSYRLRIKAKNSAMWTLFLMVLSIALGAWFVRAALTDHWSTIALALAGLLSLFAMFSQAGETRKLMDLAAREEAEEWRQYLKPRL